MASLAEVRKGGLDQGHGRFLCLARQRLRSYRRLASCGLEGLRADVRAGRSRLVYGNIHHNSAYVIGYQDYQLLSSLIFMSRTPQPNL